MNSTRINTPYQLAARIRGSERALSSLESAIFVPEKSETPTLPVHGNNCKLFAYEGRGHGFLNGSWFRPKNGDQDFKSTIGEMDQWLTNVLKILDACPLPDEQVVVPKN